MSPKIFLRIFQLIVFNANFLMQHTKKSEFFATDYGNYPIPGFEKEMFCQGFDVHFSKLESLQVNPI